MHNRPRYPSEAEKQKQAIREKKIAKYVALREDILSVRKSHLSDRSYSVLDKLDTLLLISPEFHTMWNYRKECITDAMEGLEVTDNQDGSDGKMDETDDADHVVVGDEEEEEHDKQRKKEQRDTVVKMLERELALTERILKEQHIKSYQTWYHRKWTVEKLADLHGHDSEYTKRMCARDLDLCAQLLRVDERNFHCWNYRRSVLQLARVDPDTELQFTMQQIERHPGNYSAWHNRSALLTEKRERLMQDSENIDAAKQTMNSLIEQEFETATHMFFTDPFDQSCWIYHRWLLSTPESAEISMLEKDLEMCNELLEIEPDCKWALLTTTLLQLKSHYGDKNLTQSEFDAVLALIDKLQKIDRMHSAYYADLRSDLIIEHAIARAGSEKERFEMCNDKRITRFDSVIRDPLFCNTLTHLDLSGNGILFIPQTFGKLTKLQYLNISGNKIQFLENLDDNEELKTIIANNNKITAVVSKVPSAQHINISGNPISMHITIEELRSFFPNATEVKIEE